MKHMKFITVVTLLLAAVINIQSVVALPSAVQPAVWSVSSEPPVQPADDDREEPDDNQCDDFEWPACEAHRD
jgi:hypothetical protein